jgi:homoserine kinase
VIYCKKINTMKKTIQNPVGNGTASSIAMNIAQLYAGIDVVENPQSKQDALNINPYAIPGLEKNK